MKRAKCVRCFFPNKKTLLKVRSWLKCIGTQLDFPLENVSAKYVELGMDSIGLHHVSWLKCTNKSLRIKCLRYRDKIITIKSRQIIRYDIQYNFTTNFFLYTILSTKSRKSGNLS